MLIYNEKTKKRPFHEYIHFWLFLFMLNFGRVFFIVDFLLHNWLKIKVISWSFQVYDKN